MIARPKRWERHRRSYLAWPGDEYFTIEFEVVKPPSAEGRAVHVILDNDDVVWLLGELRRHGIDVRSTPMTS